MNSLNNKHGKIMGSIENYEKPETFVKKMQLQNPDKTELKVSSDVNLAMDPEDNDSVLIDWEDDDTESDDNKLGQQGRVDFDISIISVDQLGNDALDEADKVPPSRLKARRMAMRPKKPIVLPRYLRNKGSKKSLKASISVHSMKTLLKSASTATTSAKTSLNLRKIRLDENQKHSVKKLFDKRDIFLNLFEELPSLSDISSEPTLEEESTHVTKHVKKVSTKKHDDEEGAFFNPLTGQSLSSTTSSPSSLPSAEVIEECVEATDEDVDFPSVLDEPIFRKSEIAVSDFHLFRIFDKSFAANNIEPEEAVAMQQTVKIRGMVNEFLVNLFDEVVQKAERADAHNYADNFCKSSLVFKLMQLICDYKAVKATNINLNRKVVEHHKRSKMMRAISPLNPEIELKEHTRYMQELKMYDHTLKKSLDLKEHYDKLIDYTNDELDRTKSNVALYEEHFNELIRETIGTDQSDVGKNEIEFDIKRIESKRNELSAKRLHLIRRQHTLSSLEEKTAKLDKISDNLHMDTFIVIQTEVQELSKKVEDHNADLKKIQTSCNVNLHILAHLREKTVIETTSNEGKRILLEDMTRQQRLKRKNLFKLKVDRGKFRTQYDDISFQSGLLLANPALMYDYDNSVAQLAAQKKRVHELQAKLSKLLETIKVKKLLIAQM